MNYVVGNLVHRVGDTVDHTKDAGRNVKIRGGKVAPNFATPTLSSTSQKPMPRNLVSEDVYISVTDNLDQQSRKRGEDFLLASRIAQELKGHLMSFATFAETEQSAKVVFAIEVTAASSGNRWDRYWKGDTGFVRLGLSFSIHDQTMGSHPILKHGKVVYVNPLKDATIRRRCSKGSGEKSLLSVLPVVSRQLINEVIVDSTYASSELA